ncbi:MAG: F0F1 ATP synthase subunit B', partial [Campylobacter sp.]|nr:F0F1 ATP synthase subunit B' [Campylobacter sp.]
MLHIDPPLLLITLVIFLGLIFVLNSILYKPLLGFIDDRNKSIKNDEESVSKNASDTGNYEAQIEKIIG